MEKATQVFMADRQKHVPNVKIRLISGVKRVGGGALNLCYENSYDAKQAGGKNVVMLSGWLVQPYDDKTKSTAIIQHWWNANLSGDHFDTTPLADNSDCDYVQDTGIYMFCLKNDSRLSTHKGFDLLHHDGQYEVLYDQDSMLFRTIQELKTENFYSMA